MKGTDVITRRVRVICNDADDGSYSVEDAEAIIFLNDGVRLIIKLRPDARINTAGSLLTITDITDLTGTIGISDNWIVELTDYVCSRFFDCDSGDIRDLKRAESHFAKFMLLIKA